MVRMVLIPDVANGSSPLKAKHRADRAAVLWPDADFSGNRDQSSPNRHRPVVCWTVTIAQIIDLIWRPRRDLNPCYRRERAVS